MVLSLNSLIKINSNLITEHNRKYSSGLTFTNEDKTLLAGAKKRFIRPSKKSFDFSWSYLPDKAASSIDGLSSRDFLYNIASTNSLVSLGIQDDHQDLWHYYSCIITGYSENIIKIDIPNQCRYYDVSLKLGEI